MKTFTIWYMRPDWLLAGMTGSKPKAADLGQTHVQLKTVELADNASLDDVYFAMQGECWSPNGEAHGLIASKGLRHTSMSVGDVIVDDAGCAHLVASFGFEALPEAA